MIPIVSATKTNTISDHSLIYHLEMAPGIALVQKSHTQTFSAFKNTIFFVGLRFGLMQSKVGLAVLLKDYEFTLNPKTRTPLKMNARSMVLTADGGVWLDVKKL